jgi:hypothetical protein
MSLGRARAMSQLAGEADCSALANKVLLSHRALDEERKLRGVNGSCERRAPPPKAGHLEGTLANPCHVLSRSPPTAMLAHRELAHAKRTPNEAQNALHF